MDADPASREAAYAPAVERLAVSFGDAATELASALGGAPPSILDVGAGSGVWSLQMARRCAVTRVTALDLPAVLDRFRDRARSLGLADRISAIAGDYHEVDVPPAAYDRVVLANVVHLEPPDRAARLLSRARGWVRPGGEVVVVDALGRPPAEDSATAVYAIHLALRTGSGRVHARAQIEGWLRDAGLATRFVALTAPPGQLGAIVATAP
jgi:cyclopropane fatty-acyl-phospholipid synthase-like methyltransferase